MENLKLRDYQNNVVSDVVEYYKKGIDTVMIQSPVGSGKTIMALQVIKKLQENFIDMKVNWVAPRKHLLQQVMDVNSNYFDCDITPVSLFAKDVPYADLVVLDEAHHEATQSCVLLYEKCKNRLTLGLSATPLRTDRMKLSFKKTVTSLSITKLIQNNYLSPYHLFTIPQWDPLAVARLYLREPNKWGKSIVFFSTINECRVFQEFLELKRVPCEVVTGTSNKDKQLYKFLNGEVPIIANVQMLTEGFDLPDLKSVFIRDASRLPTIQMAGRGLRLHPEKRNCNIIQSQETKFSFEKMAPPQKSFLYKKQTWLSVNDDTEIIKKTILYTFDRLRNMPERKPPLSPRSSCMYVRF